MEIQTILSIFLGINQEAPLGGSWVIPSVTSLTERSVCMASYRSMSIRMEKLHIKNEHIFKKTSSKKVITGLWF